MLTASHPTTFPRKPFDCDFTCEAAHSTYDMFSPYQYVRCLIEVDEQGAMALLDNERLLYLSPGLEIRHARFNRVFGLEAVGRGAPFECAVRFVSVIL